jgi:hypothetical protein
MATTNMESTATLPPPPPSPPPPLSPIEALPDDVLALVFGCLGAADLGRAATACTRFKAVLNANARIWEGALFELDPVGVLGPHGAAAAYCAGVTPLALAHALGDHRCHRCRATSAARFSPDLLHRYCINCHGWSLILLFPRLVNRFYFVPASDSRSVHVSTWDELCSALHAFDDYRDAVTIVIDASIALEKTLTIKKSVQLVGNPELWVAPTLSSDGVTALQVQSCGVVLDRVNVTGGPDLYTLEERHRDVRTGKVNYEAFPRFPAVVVYTGELIVHDSRIFGPCGAAVELWGGGASISLHGCQVRSEDLVGCANYDPQPHFDGCRCPRSLFAARGCTFSGALDGNICVGNLSAADELALREFNDYWGRRCIADIIPYAREGVCEEVDVQPWRTGALAAALRAEQLRLLADGDAAATAAAAAAVRSTASDEEPPAKRARAGDDDA